MPLPFYLAVILHLLLPHPSTPESTLTYQISESEPPGTLIGQITSTPPYLIVPVPGSSVDSDLTIDPQSGEIRTKVKLDRETRNKYTFVALAPTGENIRVVINVLDENDNTPTFPHSTVTLEFPENTPRDVKRTLPPARDLDLGIYNTQRYVIATGNVNNAFRLSSHRERDGVLYLDLQVNGFLDRETTPLYNLVIEAYDGGMPALKSTLNVKIKIEDVNDNSPVFNQSKYFATISENVTIGTRVLQVFATDTDSGVNNKITYSINRRQTDRESNFKINQTTGIISTNKILDYEAKELHELVVVAKDGGVQPLETTVFVSIRVIDVKDNELSINIFYLDNGRVSEKASVGEFIARVTVTESKVEKKNIDLSISGATFKVEKRGNVNYIVTKTLLDREKVDKYELTLTATDGVLRSHANVTIEVTDVNDCAPEFERPEYEVDILETVEIGTSVLKVTARDRDDDKELFYESQSDMFKVDNHGVVTTKSLLKCEDIAIVKFQIVATDSGGLRSSTNVIVNVFDGNDHGPVFEFSFYNVSLKEGEGGRCFMNITATDPDCGLNSLVNYTIRGDRGPFTIGSSGQICLGGQLDFEKQRVYELAVVATDRGHLSTTTLVKINVIDLNDNWPIFTHSNMSTKIGSSISVLATDADSGLFGQITYKIVNTTKNYKINSTSGEITGRSNQPEHLVISAKDGGGLETFANVYIGHGDGCGNWRFEVSEDVNVGTEIGRVMEKAETYKIQGGSSQFSIDNTGLIRTTQKLDRETEGSVLFNIQAVNGRQTSHCQVTILILDSNDNPPIFKSRTATITLPENTAINTPVYAVYATDPDLGLNAQITYSLNSHTFQVDNSGSIILKSPLDFETTKSYNLIITAQDGGTPRRYTNMTVIVQILDLNDNRPDIKEIGEVKVQEDVAVGTVVVEVQASDADSGNNGRVTYAMAAVQTDFAINAQTGIISTARQLDRETNAKYMIAVKAVDHGQPPISSTMTLTILILDSNDNHPEFRKEYEFDLDENNRVGFEIGTVVAIDRDAGENGKVVYTLEDGVPFSIGKHTGKLTATKRLDREQKSKYEIQVTASDLGDPPRQSTTLVTVKIRDQNDNRPEITGETFVTREGDSEVGTVMATDIDAGENAKLVYGLVGDSADFTIDKMTGVIRSKVQLNSEKTYVLNVKVKDRSVKPLESTREFRIKVLNEDRVLERRFTVQIAEDTKPGSLIFTLPTQSSYNLLPNPNFTVNKTTGDLYTTSLLDYETTTNYTIQVTSANTISHITIQILDTNDNRPIFPSHFLEIDIPEDTQLSHGILNLTATDADSAENGTVRYEILTQSPDAKFRINKLTGVVHLSKELDYEINRNGYFIVMAFDQCQDYSARLNSTVTVTVNVQNVNDNRPTIVAPSTDITADYSFNVIADDKDGDELTFNMSQSPYFKIDERGRVMITKEFVGSMEYNVTVTDGKFMDFQVGRVTIGGGHSGFQATNYTATIVENCRVGTEVVKVGGGGGSGEYLLPMSSPPQFAIHPKSGQIYVTGQIDRESNPTFTLFPHLISNSKIISTTIVHVTVKDTNDNQPDFHETCETLNVPENQEFSVIHTFRAVDPDTGRNGEVSYTIIGGDNLFTVDLHTGELKAKSLDRERTGIHELVVIAQDRGLPVQRKSCNFTVIVGDENDEEPEFTKQIYSAHVFENAGIGTTVLTVRATDADTGKNSEIKYSLSNESDWHFRVDNRTGVVTTAGPLDREKTGSYTFEITATDGGLYDARSSKTIVKITIRDVNDNRPVWVKNPVVLKVPTAVAGQSLVKVEAVDSDEGVSGEVVYSLLDTTLFRVNPMTGVISPVVSLDVGKMFNLQVVAKDKGTPSMSSVGLVVIQVGEVSNQIKLREEYLAEVKENSPKRTSVVKVHAFTHNRREEINYKIIGEDYGFEIIEGEIRVRDSSQIDREKVNVVSLVVEVRADSNFAHTVVRITISDENDNPPIFNQNSYFAAVWEGNNKGTFVAQVTASDPDSTPTPLLYQIIDGNQDNAFIIDPPFSGLVKTNIVLDRETLDNYKLTIIATDEGSPQLTGTTTLVVNVIDINDTPPTFPPSTTVRLSRDTKIGTNIITLSANDVDANPNLVYSVESQEFAVGKYSGKVWLKDGLSGTEVVQVVVSDGVHVAVTELNVQVVSGNEHSPVFDQAVYRVVQANDNSENSKTRVTATDKDSGINGRIKYSIRPTIYNVTIDEESGVIHSNGIRLKNLTQFIVTGTDGGGKSAEATLWVEPAGHMRHDGGYRTQISEAAKPGSIVYNFDFSGHFELTGGDGMFSIGSTGQLVTTSTLDRETKSNYTLGITTAELSTEIIIKILDENENPPYSKNRNISISESKPVGSPLIQLTASDLDEVSTEFTFTTASCPNLFKLTPSGLLTLAKKLDYETSQSHSCSVLISDGKFSSLCYIQITVLDEDDHAPEFPINYTESIPENSPVGTIIFQAKAIDLDAGIYSRLNYSTTSDYFSVDSTTGYVRSKMPFDYESDNQYNLKLVATDIGGRSTVTNVIIDIDPVDEYAPEFRKSYNFIIPGNAPLGYVIGSVHAIDKDSGIDGVVIYSVEDQNYDINNQNGEITLRGDLTNGTLIVTAKSTQLSTTTSVTISTGPDNAMQNIWLIIIIIAVILITVMAVIVVLHRRRQQQSKTKDNSDPYNPAFDTLEYVQSVEQRQSYSPSEPDHSSGRGSAEDMEDEEIAMINELQGEIPAKNAQEYFARLGIRPKPDNMDDPDNDQDIVDGVDISNLIYSQIVEDFPVPAGSVSVKSEEGGAGWDYLLDWGPQYQPLASVFAEIAEMGGNSGGPEHRIRQQTLMQQAPRSPISHDCSSGPISPSFTPALSPLSNCRLSPRGAVIQRYGEG